MTNQVDDIDQALGQWLEAAKRLRMTLSAHVGFFTDADSPTFLLAELTRRQGVYSLEEAVHRITQASADVIGL